MGEKRFIADPSPWTPICDATSLKVLGKLAEELFECSEAAIGAIGQSPEGYEDALTKEVADVLCNVELAAEYLGIDLPMFHGRLSHPRPTSELIRAIGRCGAAVARCIIQGVDEAEPSTGEINRDWLLHEMIFVRRCCAAVITDRGLDSSAIDSRMTFKRAHLTRWHQMEIIA